MTVMTIELDRCADAAPSGWRMLAPFRFREYRLLNAAVAISIFASGMWAVVMALQVIALDDDPSSLSLVAAGFAGGMLAFTLVGGIAADRIPQRSIIIAVEAVNFAAVCAVSILALTGTLALWHMAMAATLLGVGAGFFYPAYSAYLPRILPPEQLLAANGVEGVVRSTLQQAVGPAIAGVLVGATLPSVGLVAVAILFGSGLTLLIATRPPTLPQTREQRPHPLTELRDGYLFVVRTPWLLWTLLFASVFVLAVLGPIEVLLPFITADRFDDGARAYGLVLAAFGVGSAIGALLVSSGRMPRRYLTVALLGWGFGALPLAVIGWTSSLLVMVAATFVVGLTDGVGTVIWGTLLQRRVAPEMLGRVSSLDFFVSLAFLPVSMALAGPLSKVISLQAIFVAAAVIPAVLAVVALVAARMREDELAHPL